MSTETDLQRRAFARLFPSANVIEQLQPLPPVVGVLAARTWWRTSAAAVLVGLSILVELLLLTPRTDLFAWGPLLPVIGIAALALGIGGLVWSARQLRPRGERQRIAWDEWARTRGFQPVEALATGRRRWAVGSGRLTLRPSRRYTPVYAARLASGVLVTITNAYVCGPWGIARNRRLGNFAAMVELPASTAERYPASALDRFVRGRRPWRGRATARLRPLHLESSDFEDACELRVDAGSDELEWWRLLEPTMLDGLAREWSVSWQQFGRSLVVYVPAPVGPLDARQLDAVCDAAVGIGARFTAAAALPAPTGADVERIRARQRERYTNRHRVRAALAWGLLLAVLFAPIVFVSVRSAHEHSLDEDAHRSTYAASTVSHDLVACLDRVKDVAADRDACFSFDDSDRARLLARSDYYYSDPGELDTTTVRRDGEHVTITTVSDHGTRFVITERTDDAFSSARYTCSPKGRQCDGGTWGITHG